MCRNCKSFVRSAVFILGVSIGMVSCSKLPDDLPSTAITRHCPFVGERVSYLVGRYHYPPPSNPLAPAHNDSLVTIKASLHLDGLRWSSNNELYACIYSGINTYNLMMRTVLSGSINLQFWQLDAPMLQPGFAGMTDTICVGDTIAVTGYPYSLFNRTATALDVRFVQKYSSPKRDEFK